MYSLKRYEEPGGIKTRPWCRNGVRSGNPGFPVKIRSGLDALHAETAECEEIVDRMNGRDRDQPCQEGV